MVHIVCVEDSPGSVLTHETAAVEGGREGGTGKKKICSEHTYIHVEALMQTHTRTLMLMLTLTLMHTCTHTHTHTHTHTLIYLSIVIASPKIAIVLTSTMKGTKVLTLGAGREVLPHNMAVTKM